MKNGLVKDSLSFTKYVFRIVCLLIFGFKILSYGRIQTTLKEQDRSIIKQHESKEQLHKTTWRETRMIHNLTYNREFISKIEINSTTMVMII